MREYLRLGTRYRKLDIANGAHRPDSRSSHARSSALNAKGPDWIRSCWLDGQVRSAVSVRGLRALQRASRGTKRDSAFPAARFSAPAEKLRSRERAGYSILRESTSGTPRRCSVAPVGQFRWDTLRITHRQGPSSPIVSINRHVAHSVAALYALGRDGSGSDALGRALLQRNTIKRSGVRKARYEPAPAKILDNSDSPFLPLLLHLLLLHPSVRGPSSPRRPIMRAGRAGGISRCRRFFLVTRAA